MSLRLLSLIFPLVAAALACLPSCGGHSKPQDDASFDGDKDGDLEFNSDAEDDDDADRASSLDSDIDSPEDVPDCGDGVLDSAEDCDDGNRLNNDGCDWLCRIGNGDPQPAPDDSFSPYRYEGAPVELETAPSGIHGAGERLPLAWTGSDLATVIIGAGYGSTGMELDFIRFDRDGERLDDEWIAESVIWATGLDLVWTGEHYALFFSNLGNLFMMLLNSTGKKLSDPSILTGDPCLSMSSAELASEGHAVAWDIEEYIEGGIDEICVGNDEHSALGAYVSLFADDSSGSMLAGPLQVIAGQQTFSDIAASSYGFAIASVSRLDIRQLGSVSFMSIDEEISGVVSATNLSHGVDRPSVVFGGEEYWVVWNHEEDDEPVDGDSEIDELCVARFSPVGVLVDAPTCIAPTGSGHLGEPRISFGDGGLGIVVSTEFGLLFLRTDSAGVVVGEPLEVDPLGGEYGHGPYAIVWVDTGFAVLYGLEVDDPLSIRRFAETE
jgi:cysteine-rich repeat protein